MTGSSLCRTFLSLSFQTFDYLERARSVRHQPLEETVTDNNFIELKSRHLRQIYCQTFNRKEEGKNGADWEWWLTNAAKDTWLGLRVQAKIINFKSNSFSHLHYKAGKSDCQLTKLKSAAAKDGLVPLYCFYSHWDTDKIALTETFGCSLSTLTWVESLQKAGNKRKFAEVFKKGSVFPWHMLVCPGNSGLDLPRSAWSVLKSEFGVEASKKVPKLKGHAEHKSIGLVPKPPSHVMAVLKGRTPDHPPEDLAGTLIIQGGKNH